ncbi:MAG: hypothetical protein WBP22_05100 [Candidatus Saccharimonas sp.]
MLEKVLAISSLLAAVLLLALLQVTSPASIHPIGILFVFLLLYVLALGVLTFFIIGTHWILVGLKLRRGVLSSRRAYFYASVLALAPVMLVCMQSIGRIGFYEVALVIVFEFIACFYIAKRR